MSKRFYKVNIEITNVCNLQCSFCPEVERAKDLMEVGLFRKVIEEVAPYTNVVALHLMGDPLVHPKLKELVAICSENKLQIFFVTNGVLLTAQQTDLLMHPAFRQVSFSLHSFADNFGDKDPRPYLEKIFEFTERAFKENPRLFINYRLWNLSELRGLDPRNSRLLDLIAERFGVSLDSRIAAREKKGVPVKDRLSLHFDTEFTWPTLHLPVLGTEGTCQGLSSHFGVLVDGTVVPCCLDKEGNIPLGNIQVKPLAEILASAKAKAMLEGFRENRLIEELCRKCQYIERFAESRSG